jgi:hypothetical protein
VTQQATVVQLVTVVVSPTAEPVTSTDTLISPAPSDTPIPTVTPIPTSTPIPDTPAGSILEVGQTWRQGGVALTLSDFVLHPARDDFYGQLYVGWRFANNMPTEIILSISPNNFSAKDNFGNSLKILSFYNESFWCDGHTVVVNASESFDFLDMCGPGSSGYRLPIVVNLANPQLSEVIVIASGISRIEGAQWRIPFVH